MTENPDPSVPGLETRELDLESLKALAHPLRVALFDQLSTFGPATASQLADKLDESSGATSYHLRQLERHGFVQEVDGLGSSRERWWERVPGPIGVAPRNYREAPGGTAAADLVLSEWELSRRHLIDEFLARGLSELPAEWTDASELSTSNVRLTEEQFAEVGAALSKAFDSILEPYRRKNPAGSRPVQAHLNFFPVVDGDITPEGDTDLTTSTERK